MQNPTINKPQYGVPMTVLTLLFFMWGFITCMNDILIPHLKNLFELSYLQAMLVQFSFFGAYFIGSLIYFMISYLKGDPINKIGYKMGIIVGLIISALGCFLFYPAEIYGKYPLFLFALFTLGLGFTLLQISANPYVSSLGAPEGASSRLNLAQGFNSLGTTIAPVVGGYLIFEFFAIDGKISAESTKIPYLIFGGIFLLAAILVKVIHLPSLLSKEDSNNKLGALSFPQLRGGILAIFFYVGAEVAIGSLIINFLAIPEILGVDEHIAKNYLALYWGGAMIGRFLGAISLSDKIAPLKKAGLMFATSILVFLLIYSFVDLTFNQIIPFIGFILLNIISFFIGKSNASMVLVLFAMINIVLLLVTLFGSGTIIIWSLLSIGLFNSIMWSNIFTLSITGLGSYTGQGSSLLIMGILGGALLPLLQGWLADSIGLRNSFFLPIICYAYIIGYGLYTKKLWKQEEVKGGQFLH